MGYKETKNIKDDLANIDPNTQRRFRINSGVGWVGSDPQWSKVGNTKYLTLKNPRPLHAAPTGWPDVCGWDTVEITTDMVGQKIAVFVGEEYKTGKLQLSKEQNIFKELLVRMGGIFRVIRRP